MGGDQLLVDSEGRSSISYEDFAVAILDEIEWPRHIQGRFTAGYEMAPTFLITGAGGRTGATGNHAARQLLAKGLAVRAFVFHADHRAKRLADWGWSPQLDLHPYTLLPLSRLLL